MLAQGSTGIILFSTHTTIITLITIITILLGDIIILIILMGITIHILNMVIMEVTLHIIDIRHTIITTTDIIHITITTDIIDTTGTIDMGKEILTTPILGDMQVLTQFEEIVTRTLLNEDLPVLPQKDPLLIGLTEIQQLTERIETRQLTDQIRITQFVDNPIRDQLLIVLQHDQITL